MKWLTSFSKDTNKQWKASMAISNRSGHRDTLSTKSSRGAYRKMKSPIKGQVLECEPDSEQPRA